MFFVFILLASSVSVFTSVSATPLSLPLSLCDDDDAQVPFVRLSRVKPEKNVRVGGGWMDRVCQHK